MNIGGQRKKGIVKKTFPAKPLITVITAVYNCASTIDETIRSVLNQTYENIEYIIIDGGSTDGTLDIIKKYDDQIDYWLSEPDGGIYYAMNKGIALASGEWINFMNAGDTFYRNDIIESIYRNNVNGADLIYGHHEVVYNDQFIVVKKARRLEKLWKEMVFRHQSLFTKAALLKKRPFNLSYVIGADFDFIYYAFVNNYTFYNTDQVISRISVGGFSDNNLLKANDELCAIVQKHKGSLKVRLYYTWLHHHKAFKLWLKKRLPRNITEAIIYYKNR